MNEPLSRLHWLSRVTVAFVWIYHGLVPKLLGPHADELHLAALHGLPDENLTLLLKASGVAEILFGITVLVFYRSRWPFVISVLLLIALLLDIAVMAPDYLLGAFNPVSLNVSVIGLSLIGYLTAPKRSDGRV